MQVKPLTSQPDAPRRTGHQSNVSEGEDYNPSRGTTDHRRHTAICPSAPEHSRRPSSHCPFIRGAFLNDQMIISIRQQRVVPVQTGVFRHSDGASFPASRCPRADGGIPMTRSAKGTAEELSPCRRGYSLTPSVSFTGRPVVPVQTGVFRAASVAVTAEPSCPRADGGIPAPPKILSIDGRFTPYLRGYSWATRGRPHKLTVIPVQTGYS